MYEIYVYIFIYCNISQLTVFGGEHGGFLLALKKRTLTYKLSVPHVLHFVLPKHPVKLREISDAALKRNEICWLCELCCELGVVSVSLSRWTAVNPRDDDRGEAWLGTGSSSWSACSAETMTARLTVWLSDCLTEQYSPSAPPLLFLIFSGQLSRQTVGGENS